MESPGNPGRFNSLLPSLLAGSLLGFMGWLLAGRTSWDWKIFTKTATVLTVVAVIIFTYVVPPYSVRNANACLSPQGTTQVTGDVVRSLLRFAAYDVAIQIKIFPAGAKNPLHPVAEFGMTGEDGTFGVVLPSPQPPTGLYLINAAYNYDSPFWRDRWYIKDFRRADTPTCEERVPVVDAGIIDRSINGSLTDGPYVEDDTTTEFRLCESGSARQVRLGDATFVISVHEFWNHGEAVSFRVAHPSADDLTNTGAIQEGAIKVLTLDEATYSLTVLRVNEPCTTISIEHQG